MKRFMTLCGLVTLISLPFATVTAQTDTTFTYQGKLSLAGTPVNGTADFRFNLMTTGGGVLGTQTVFDVPIMDGCFNVELDFGSNSFNLFTGTPRTLEIEVRSPAGSGSFATLSPPQTVTRTPYAIQTRGLYADDDLNVGIGTSVPHAPLHVREGQSGSNGQGNSSAIFERSGQNFLSILSPSSSERGILFGDETSVASGGIVYNNPSTPDGIQFRTNGNVNRMVLTDNGQLGVGTTNPGARLSVSQTDSGDEAILALSNNNVPAINVINLGNGYALAADGGSDASPSGGGVMIVGNEASLNIAIDTNEIMARDGGNAATLLINREGGDVVIGSASGGSATLVTPVLQITGGSDLSEMFDLTGDVQAQPGMLVVIDPDHPGRLVPSSSAYDTKVAGIISGAGGVATGMTMGQTGTIADGKHPVALSGRVYCLADATQADIQPGDLLTTSSILGHAMKVRDRDAAGGAIIGKAMSELKHGQTGLVLVLVNLQ